MDEDEEADRAGGGWKMSEHMALCFSCCRIPICKQSATSRIALKPLPFQSLPNDRAFGQVLLFSTLPPRSAVIGLLRRLPFSLVSRL